VSILLITVNVVVTVVLTNVLISSFDTSILLLTILFNNEPICDMMFLNTPMRLTTN
jgi:hypothetical protein